MTVSITPLEIGSPPTDRPFNVRLEDEMGPDFRWDFGPCVMINGEICGTKYRQPLHSGLKIIGWREVPNV